MELLDWIQYHLPFHSEQYKLLVEAATIGVLFYAGLTDFRTFKIPNETVLLLLTLYIFYAPMFRSLNEVLWNVVVCLSVTTILIALYTRRVVGGGDVKLVSVVSLWVGTHCALAFSLLLLGLVGLHAVAAKMGWAPTQTLANRQLIAYAPSVAGALIGTILIGCV